MKPKSTFNNGLILFTKMNLMIFFLVTGLILTETGNISGQVYNVTVTITSDNAYVFGFGVQNGITDYRQPGVANDYAYEIYGGGAGTEQYQIVADIHGYIYIAAWSDESTYQGTIAQFTDGTTTIRTGPTPSSINPNVEWQVYATDSNLYPTPDATPHPTSPLWIPHGNTNCPTLQQINHQIWHANNNTGSLTGPNGGSSKGWVGRDAANNPTGSVGLLAIGPVNVALTNGFPYSAVSNIDPTTNWMWYTRASTYTVGSNAAFVSAATGEYYIFRIGPLIDLFGHCPVYKDTLYTKIESDVTYNKSTIWDGKMYIAPNVTVSVSSGNFLDISGVDVVLDHGAGININGGAYLRANNSVFRPCWIKDTWRGIHFIGGVLDSNIVNECTFKNAEAALYFQEGADAVVSANLFSNCGYGIRVEMNPNFNHPISGNHFVTDDYYPSFGPDTVNSNFYYYSFTPGLNSETHAIDSRYTSRFRGQVSQNAFVNAKGTRPRTIGIFQNTGGGRFTENTFTDVYGPIWLQYTNRYTCIENNEIEQDTVIGYPTIYVQSSSGGTIIDINNNEIYNNYNKASAQSAIYAYGLANVRIFNNNIKGFTNGIISYWNYRGTINRNDVYDCGYKNGSGTGISVYEGQGSSNKVACNNIKMRNFNSLAGIYCTYNSTSILPTSEISSNCISDCKVSMMFSKYAISWPPRPDPVLPKIRNNFLYNYTDAGIKVNTMLGNIGTKTPTDPGLNTLWSNKNSAIDIFCNNTLANAIQVADNFGMFNISIPGVSIVSNNPFCSTASCAQQIFNMPSQGQLNVNYNCDSLTRGTLPPQPLFGSRGNFHLATDYRELLKSSPEPYEDAAMIMANYAQADASLLSEILEVTQLSDNEKALLQYEFYYRNADYNNARIYLNQFSPTTSEEQEYKTLRVYNLAIAEHGTGVLTYNDVQLLKSYRDKNIATANFATAILNDFSDYADYKVEDLKVNDVEITGEIRHIEPGGSLLRIYPNPVTSTAFIELVNTNSSTSKIEVFDKTGKKVSEYMIEFMAGGIIIDMKRLADGFYFVTLTDPSSGFIQKGKLLKVSY